jgi:hypothetical protein
VTPTGNPLEAGVDRTAGERRVAATLDGVSASTTLWSVFAVIRASYGPLPLWIANPQLPDQPIVGGRVKFEATIFPAGPAGRVEPPGRTPAEIRAELPDGLRAQFDAEYGQALEEAKASYQLDRLNEVMQGWWQLAWARRSPTHEQALATGARLLDGGRVETFSVDVDALRR